MIFYKRTDVLRSPDLNTSSLCELFQFLEELGDPCTWEEAALSKIVSVLMSENRYQHRCYPGDKSEVLFVQDNRYFHVFFEKMWFHTLK